MVKAMKTGRKEILRELLDIMRKMFIAREYVSSLFPKLGDLHESLLAEVEDGLDKAIENLKTVIGEVIVENILESWEKRRID